MASDARSFLPPDALKISEARDYFVVQHNDIAQRQQFLPKKNAGNSLTVTEEKILAYLISQIKPNSQTLDPMIFDVKTFCQICGLGRGDTDNCYPQIKAAVEKLSSRVMWLCDERAQTETTVRYIQRVTFYKRSGLIGIQFDPMMAPYLINLAGNYFRFSFHNILAMKSRYSIQLYKMLKSYYFQSPSIRFDIEHLKVMLDATSYTKISHLKSKIIEPALRDINRYSDLSVSVEYEKTGHKVTHVIFFMKDLERKKDQTALKEAQERYSNTEKELQT